MLIINLKVYLLSTFGRILYIISQFYTNGIFSNNFILRKSYNIIFRYFKIKNDKHVGNFKTCWKYFNIAVTNLHEEMNLQQIRLFFRQKPFLFNDCLCYVARNPFLKNDYTVVSLTKEFPRIFNFFCQKRQCVDRKMCTLCFQVIVVLFYFYYYSTLYKIHNNNQYSGMIILYDRNIYYKRTRNHKIQNFKNLYN